MDIEEKEKIFQIILTSELQTIKGSLIEFRQHIDTLQAELTASREREAALVSAYNDLSTSVWVLMVEAAKSDATEESITNATLAMQRAYERSQKQAAQVEGGGDVN